MLPGRMEEIMGREKTTENHQLLEDFGSERLPTEAAQNPWDVPADPGSVPPSTTVAGDGQNETAPSQGATSDNG